MQSMPEISAETAQRIRELNGGMKNTMIVTFYMDAVLDEKESYGWMETRFDPVTGEKREFRKEGKGYAVYVDVPFVEIRAPGDTLNVIRKPAQEIHKLRYPEEWAAYLNHQAAPSKGTPIDKLPFLTKARVLELQSLGLKTAENIRDIADVNAVKIMDFQRLRQRVNDFLDEQAKLAPLETMRREVEKRDEQIELMQKQIATLMEAATAPTPAPEAPPKKK